MDRKFSTTQLLPLLLIAFTSSVLADCNRDEVGYVASFTVKPGSEVAFESAISHLAQTVMRVETGVILYAPYRGAQGKYFMMERYENQAAREAHGKSKEVSDLFPGLGEYLVGAPDIQPVGAVCPH